MRVAQIDADGNVVNVVVLEQPFPDPPGGCSWYVPDPEQVIEIGRPIPIAAPPDDLVAEAFSLE